MRRPLGPLFLTLLLTPLLAGCGSSSPGPVEDVDHPDPSGTDPVSFTEVALVSQSAAGGHVGRRATVLDSQAAVAAFTRQFRVDSVGHRIETAIRKSDPPKDQTVVGQVVAVGCDEPTSVRVKPRNHGLTIVADPVPSPHEECLVPVTTVAVVTVDSGSV
jgi:hypothetical protein